MVEDRLNAASRGLPRVFVVMKEQRFPARRALVGRYSAQSSHQLHILGVKMQSVLKRGQHGSIGAYIDPKA
jgi:hypothetical protein